MDFLNPSIGVRFEAKILESARQYWGLALKIIGATNSHVSPATKLSAVPAPP